MEENRPRRPGRWRVSGVIHQQTSRGSGYAWCHQRINRDEARKVSWKTSITCLVCLGAVA